MNGEVLKKFRTFGFLCVGATALVFGGSGLASAEVASTVPVAETQIADAPLTGSAAFGAGIAKILGSGSSAYCPGGVCPK
ncbi:hypothetical protein [Nocardia sp. CS682]|uniref:hypothetical protein n=1 Tax=Nocardia sp. CS682 TaxID=1047172 RepID=UPI001074E6CD|nr:hypothetical protein [Nocardia sp. CS682]QBS41066.1 hypothetical protein DMB37_14035 [Nocardia sp. CS682]